MPGTGRGRPGIKRNAPASNRKIDEAKILTHAEAGLSTYEIAKIHGVNQSSVQRFLAQAELDKADTERYKSMRADLLSHTGSKLQGVINHVVATLERDADNGILGALSAREKTSMVRDLAVTQGVIFDKERLERGESTQNISTVSRMLDSRLGGLHKRNLAITNKDDEAGG